jgi:hypothetical protein
VPLPQLDGPPIRVYIRPDLGPHLAATSIPRRTIELDACVLRQRGDFERILVHELFHFVWIRLGNPLRREWSDLLASELSRGGRGELGWSAEWRKNTLCADDIGSPATARKRSSKWSRYTRESFCDTAAFLYAGLAHHDEFTLARRECTRRRAWFERACAAILKI